MWKKLTLDHWKEHRPKMVTYLEELGVLEKAVELAVEQAHQELAALRASGSHPEAAREWVMQMYLLLPSEEDAAELPPDRAPFMSETSSSATSTPTDRTGQSLNDSLLASLRSGSFED